MKKIEINVNQKNWDLIESDLEDFRKEISMPEGNPIEEAANSGICEYLKIFTSELFDKNVKIQIESVWIFCNLSFSVTKIICPSILENCVRFLLSENDDLLNNVKSNIFLFFIKNKKIKKKSICSIANFLGDSDSAINDILSETHLIKYTKKLLLNINKELEMMKDKNAKKSLLNTDKELEMMKDCLWMIANIMKNYTEFQNIEILIEPICYCLNNCDNEDIIYYCLWSLSYCTAFDDEMFISIIIDSIDNANFFKLLKHKNGMIKTPTVRLCCNILSSNDDFHIQVIIKNIFEFLKN